MAAVAASFRELLLAYRRGQLPHAGPFAALYHVPFPHPESPTLCAKFAPENLGERLTAILDSINWYSKIPWFGPGLTRECVLEYLAALPRIMGWFRADVAATRDPALARMPSEYVEAFQRIE